MTTPTTTQKTMIPRNAAQALTRGPRSRSMGIRLLIIDTRATRSYATSSGQPVEQCAEDGSVRPSPSNRATPDSDLVIPLLMSRRRRRRALGLPLAVFITLLAILTSCARPTTSVSPQTNPTQGRDTNNSESVSPESSISLPTSFSGGTDVVLANGYSYRVTYRLDSLSHDPISIVDDAPGKASSFVGGSGTMTLKNTTPGRNAEPIGFFIGGLYSLDRPACQIYGEYYLPYYTVETTQPPGSFCYLDLALSSAGDIYEVAPMDEIEIPMEGVYELSAVDETVLPSILNDFVAGPDAYMFAHAGYEMAPSPICVLSLSDRAVSILASSPEPEISC